MKKKYEITEAKYEDNDKYKKNNKTNNIYDKLFIGILVFVILILLVLLVLSFIADKKIFDNKSNDNSDVEIKYSEVVTDVKTGIYITDV